MYSEAAADHFHNPRQSGVLEGADAVGRQGTPGQGPYMVLYLCVEQEGRDMRIAEARFQTYGCPAAIACGSWVAEWARGKTVEEAGALEPAMIEAGLGSLPLGKEHCPPLAVAALRDGLSQLCNGWGRAAGTATL